MDTIQQHRDARHGICLDVVRDCVMASLILTEHKVIIADMPISTNDPYYALIQDLVNWKRDRPVDEEVATHG